MSKEVTFEQKKALIKLGYDFDSLCFCGGSMDCICEHLPDENKLIPVSEALDWIREEKGRACAVGLNVNSDNRFLGNYIYEYIIENNRVEGCSGFDTHPLSESALLGAVLDYLIEK